MNTTKLNTVKRESEETRQANNEQMKLQGVERIQCKSKETQGDQRKLNERHTQSHAFKGNQSQLNEVQGN